MIRGRSAVCAVVVLSTSLLLAGCSSGDSGGSEAAEAGSWSFTDGSGKTVELDERPQRIIAHAYAAAA